MLHRYTDKTKILQMQTKFMEKIVSYNTRKPKFEYVVFLMDNQGLCIHEFIDSSGLNYIIWAYNIYCRSATWRQNCTLN